MLFRVGDHRSGILNAWHKGTDPILDTGIACSAADAELDPVERRSLVKSLPFSASTFSKFVRIGSDKRLYDPAIRDELPPKFTVLYLLSQLTSEEFEAFVHERLLSSRLKRSDLERWKKERQGPTLTPPRVPALPNDIYAAVKPASPVTEIDEHRFRERLYDLAKLFGMEVVYPTERYKSPTDQALAYVREQAKKVVQFVLKQRRKKLKSYGGKIPPYLKNNPGYALGDIEIGPEDDLDRVQRILTKIGRAEEFRKIRMMAIDAYGFYEPIDGFLPIEPPAAAGSQDNPATEADLE